MAWNVSSSFLRQVQVAVNAAGPVVFVACASHAGVDVAPESAPTWSRSACTSTRSSSSSNRARCLRSSTSATRCSAGVIDHVGVSASRSNAPESDAANRTTACPAARLPAAGGGGGGAITVVMHPR